MIIHNWFSDILLSVRVLLDNIIFAEKKLFINNLPEYFIKHYEFSLASRTFVLAKDEFKPNFELPSCIVTLGEDNYIFGERPTTSQHIRLDNFNQIPVLIDNTKNIIINIQEEQTTVGVTGQINCESQLQAKEIEFTMKRWLPLAKYIQLFDFTSFLEISPEIMLSLGMDFNHDDITNLFVKLNKNTGNIDYFYSVRYFPHIKLESVNCSISDISSRTFPVNFELTYLIQMPVWTFSEHVKFIENISIDFAKFGNEPISWKPCMFLKHTDKLVKFNIIISSLYDYGFYRLEGDLLAKYILSIKFNPKEIKFNKNMKYSMIDVNGISHNDLELLLFDEESNEIRFKILESDYIKYYNATITTPIILQVYEK